MGNLDANDMSDIPQSAELSRLIEEIARNVQDEWVQRRIDAGWQKGERRDDQAKTHPRLVRYEDLPDSEKDYDRGMVELTIKSLLTRGFSIASAALVRIDETRDSNGVDPIDLETVLTPSTLVSTLMKAWTRLSAINTRFTEDVFQNVAKCFLSNGTPVAAMDVLHQGLKLYPNDLILNQLHGLALARMGDPRKANKVLKKAAERLREAPNASPEVIEEVLGVLASTYKDLGLRVDSKTEQSQYFDSALETYARAYELTGRYWTGINEATMALLVDDPRATEVAAEVRRKCQELAERDPHNYWVLATLGEASLVLRDLKDAEHWYRLAYKASKHRFGDVDTTRRQARLVLNKLREYDDIIEEWLPIPRVALFAGNPIDPPGRASERFPGRLEKPVAEIIRKWLLENNACVGFSSAACGASIIFQEVLHEIEGEAHIVLPYEDEFVQDRVLTCGDPSWAERHEKVLQKAHRKTFASMERIQPERITFDYATLVTHGLATVRARELGTDLLGLAVWDGKPGRTDAATSIVIDRWKNLGVPVHRVDLSNVPATVNPRIPVILESPPAEKRDTGIKGSPGVEVMAMLFGDAVNFSKLSEEGVTLFVRNFFGRVKEVLDRYEGSNVVRNTWGDGLYLVFRSIRDAGLFALDVRDMVVKTNWEEFGLPADFSFRIALHTGPVVQCFDPVTGRDKWTGRHVSRAARLEPKTPPGYVFASEAFAALAATENITDFNCEYVRQLEWDKRYGTFPTYLVRRDGESISVDA